MKKRVLIVTNVLPHYRVPIFNALSTIYDLTVAYSLGDLKDAKSANFQMVKLPVKNIGRFYFHTNSLHKYCQNFDVVIGLGDISWVSIMSLLFRTRRNYKILMWGIGLRASYKNEYGEKTVWDIVRFYLFKKADALMFYSDRPIAVYVKKGFDKEKLFAVNNTVEVDIEKRKGLVFHNESIKDSIIFIGTLYKEKKVYQLLESYEIVKERVENIPKLDIVGDGEEYLNIKRWIVDRGYENSIVLHGKIIDEKVLRNLFEKALACISPGQAGLSVLKSMGYGVPFITKENAITGGEIFNIKNQYSGVMYKNDDELTDIIFDIHTNKEKYLKMGMNAKVFYMNNRTPKHMADDFVRAIESF